jgi:4-amino-4-deoxy-L-arabinose transferase-like glycosyltransferase
MFFDGELYAGISRNMALGIGGAWHPVFSATLFADYREAPPLAFVLQSLLFRLLGDHFWVEKLYSLLAGLATAAVIVAIWRRLVDSSSPWRSYSWLPVLLWITLPSWMQVYGNNLLEGTMGLFAILAVYAVLRAGEGGRGVYVWLPLAAAGVVAALLSKGPVGLYPLVTPVVAGLTLRQQGLGKSVAANAVLIGLFCIALGFALLPAGALEGFATYLRVQVFAAVAGQREHTESALGQFYIVREIICETAYSAIAAGGLVLWSRRNSPASVPKDAARNRALAFCLLTALSASLPIAISPKQSAYYAFPSYPFYALTLALWGAPALVRMVAVVKSAADSRGRLLRTAAICTLLVLLGAVLCKSLRHPHRDQDVYDDVLALARVVPKSSVISVKNFSKDVHGDGAFSFYLGRWSSISTDDRAPHEFLVLPIADSMKPPPGYVETPPQMRLYRLFKRSDSVNLATEPTALNPAPRRKLD